MGSLFVSVNDRRRQTIVRVYSSALVPVKSHTPVRVTIRGQPNQLAYLVDIDALNEQQFENLVEYLSNHFGESPTGIRMELRNRGLPLLADGCEVIQSAGESAP